MTRSTLPEKSRSPARAHRTERLLSLIGAFAVIIVIFFVFVRPWYLQWGATNEEARQRLPGDEIVPDGVGQETRGITIHASVDRVWPWLAQLGQDRGGFYSYDLLENLVGCQMPVEDVLRPETQNWQRGDKLWMYPSNKAGGAGFATLRTYVPDRALGFGTRMVGTPLSASENGSWSFALVPLNDSMTRLLIRGRGTGGRSLLGVAFDRSIFEPLHFVMERRMMIGLKQLAEGGDRGRVVNHLNVVLWTIAFALFMVAAGMVVRGPRWLLPLTAFLAAAVAFQILTFVQPPIAFSVLLVVAVGALIWWPGQHRSSAISTVKGGLQ